MSNQPSDATSALLPLHAVSLLTVASGLTLFVLRGFDDNRLTSWQWVFAAADFPALVLLLAATVILAYPAAAVGSRLTRPGLLLFAAAVAVAALLRSEPEVIVDAARYFLQAKHVETYGLAHFLAAWGRELPAWTDLPLVPLLYGALFSLFGEERAWIQAGNSLLFAGTVVLTWQVGRMLWNDTVGLTAGALLLGMPYLLVQVPLMLTDVPTMFFVMLALAATLWALRQGGSLRLGCAAAAIALAFFSKYSAWMMLMIVPAVVLGELNRDRAACARRACALAAAALLLIGLALLPLSDVVVAQLALLREYQAPALAGWQESFASTFLFQSHPFITAAAAASLWLAWRARDTRYAAVAWLPLLLLALGIRRARYLVPMLPILALMAAYALQAVRPVALRRHVVLCVVGSSLVVVFSGFLPFLQRASAVNLEQAGEYLDTLQEARVEVVALPQARVSLNPEIAVALLDLHTAKQLISRTAQAAAPPEAARLPLRFTWEHRNPASYQAAGGEREALPVAVIADGNPEGWLPPWLAQRLARHSLMREFAVSENVFRYQTLVRVYLPGASGGE